MYSEKDMEACKSGIRSELIRLLACALPFAAAGVVGFVLRVKVMFMLGFVLCGAVAIFLFDMKLAPHLRYKKHLQEISGGLSHKMAGQLVRIGGDARYEDHCWFYEFILNIYEDLDPEGERLFLFDCKKPLPQALIGRDIALTYHGKYVLDVQPLGDGHEGK